MGGEPRLGGRASWLQDFRKRRSCAAKPMGGTSCRPPNGWSKTGKSNLGVFIRLRSNPFYQKFLKTDRKPRYARHKRFFALGRGGRGVWGEFRRALASDFLLATKFKNSKEGEKLIK